MSTIPPKLGHDTVTPLISLAINNLPRGFFYLYPFIFAISVDDTKLISAVKRHGFWKFIPYYFSLLFITGIVGISCCTYALLSYAFNVRFYSTLEIQPFQALICLLFFIFAWTEVGGIMLVASYPEILRAFNSLNVLEQNCKHFRTL